MYQALYRKWRPRTFEDVIGQSHVTETLKAQVTTGRLSHAYLFTGTRGTGKTSCAKILARAVNCEHPVNGSPCNRCPACLGIENGSILDVLELDAASNNGVDQVRALRDEAIYSPAAVRKRVYIVDEVHMLSTAAFNALLKILEEPPAHLMFILATTELHKVPATILSRCQRFSFKRILPEDLAAQLNRVAQAENIPLTEDGAQLLARLSDGALRDALSLLDQCAVSSGGTVDRDAVLSTLGLAGNLKTAHMMNAIRKGDTAAALNTLGELYTAGKDMKAVLNELSALTRDLLILQTAPKGGSGLLAGGYDEATIRTLQKGMTADRLIRMLSLLQEAIASLKDSPNQRTEAELCLIRLCDERLDGDFMALSARVSALERQLAAGIPLSPASEEPSMPQSTTEDAPPWEMPPPPDDSDAPPADETAHRSASAAPAAPPAPAVDNFWGELIAPLRQSLPAQYYFVLNNKDSARGVLEGNQLTVYVQAESTRKHLSVPTVTEVLETAAAARVGHPVRVKFVVADPSKSVSTAPSGGDPMGELLSFGRGLDNVTIQ